ncbi:MAG: SH3 domain-containing protein [Alphaproteobacteria bacterium]|nr:SH3 domain-containing protein [Alphaproteobacteria bacterium]
MTASYLFPFLFIIFHAFAWAKSDLPFPRFVSLRSAKVNVHVGPGKQYPVEWVYTRQFIPVEIIAQYEHWRKIRDVDGAVSWVHVSLISGKRYGIVTGSIQSLKEKPSDSAETLARLEPGVIVALKNIQGQWLQVESRSPQGKFSGWIKGKHIWGFYPNETKF